MMNYKAVPFCWKYNQHWSYDIKDGMIGLDQVEVPLITEDLLMEIEKHKIYAKKYDATISINKEYSYAIEIGPDETLLKTSHVGFVIGTGGVVRTFNITVWFSLENAVTKMPYQTYWELQEKELT